jgi:carboxypeptidase C (cathepsin A)
LLFLFFLSALLPLAAQPAPQHVAPVEHHLPAASVTHHALDLSGRSLHFTATAEALRLTDDAGAPQAEVATIAYEIDGAAPAARPVTFVVNGGPGAASAWLQLGAAGPWRLALGGAAGQPSSPPTLQPNAETWLDFTDLVFIDPPGTGYSRLASGSEELRRFFYSVNGDIEGLADVVRQWLLAHGRMASPKYILGESYGGFRGPLLARALQTEAGIGIAGLVLLSPKLDFGSITFDPLAEVALLPSLAAAVREQAGPIDRAGLADVEAYASGEYLADLLRGPRDGAAVERMTAHVAALTGLDPALVRGLGGRVNREVFLREHVRAMHEVASAYDASVTGADPFPFAAVSRHPDPVLDALKADLAEGMAEVYATRLNWRPEADARYEVLNEALAGGWDFGSRNSRPEAVTALRTALGLDARLRVLIVHGLTDTVTPYYGTKLLLDQIPDIGAPGRIRLLVLPGGHMMYIRDGSRAALHDAAAALVEQK